MRTSIVAVGASTDLFFMGFARFGAKASERRDAMACLSQVVVMLSGKCLYSSAPIPHISKNTYGLSITNTSSSCRRPNNMPLFTNSFFLVSPKPSASPTPSASSHTTTWDTTYHY